MVAITDRIVLVTLDKNTKRILKEEDSESRAEGALVVERGLGGPDFIGYKQVAVAAAAKPGTEEYHQGSNFAVMLYCEQLGRAADNHSEDMPFGC